MPFVHSLAGAWGDEVAGFFRDWISQLREAELEEGGLGWDTYRLSLYWQQRGAVAIHTAVAQTLLERVDRRDFADRMPTFEWDRM